MVSSTTSSPTIQSSREKKVQRNKKSSKQADPQAAKAGQSEVVEAAEDLSENQPNPKDRANKKRKKGAPSEPSPLVSTNLYPQQQDETIPPKIQRTSRAAPAPASSSSQKAVAKKRTVLAAPEHASSSSQDKATTKMKRKPLVAAGSSDATSAEVCKAKKPKASRAAATGAAAPAATLVSAPSAVAALASPPSAVAAGVGRRLERQQVERAAVALCTHLERKAAEKRELIEQTEAIHMVLTTRKMPKAKEGAKQHKLIRVPLPHAWRSLEETQVTLIVKDPQRTFKDKFAAQDVNVKVIGIEKLRKKYVPFEAKRRLMGSCDVMFADDRVLPMLPRLLGSQFFKANKLPLALNLQKADLRTELERAVGGAMLRPTPGTCCDLVVATSSLTTSQIADNVEAAVEVIVCRKGGWRNIQAIHLRAANSVALPIFNSV
mmetsp:Transcript_20823/g.34334  ORF Transcript_20823/g.34334 Transcript_20823/m.34334 type:complete len:434 (+) Transcript_20823:112-1413(+)|eukprot:CAMPEP_0119306274 /NCGR_PEP_ID=MMETSP1333-20130426/7062_1 /TAXON_ID=418940 /ORGANISM="Scyphosphaera apsteinii, Strain RCC1455" /LENGTH=433 /DNA_ID=CAMNT_0007309531 /DNA_START=103 /DNA_END=1404 /DNA_ORIENTATION=-